MSSDRTFQTGHADMQRLNLTQIETRWGYRTFELVRGDITRLPVQIDVLAVSAFKGSYHPTPGTVFEALYRNRGLLGYDLASDCQFDLRDALGCWVSQPLGFLDIGRILCVEMVGGDFVLDECVANVFAVLSLLEAKGIKVRTVALPLLGAGNQALPPECVIEAMLGQSIKFMERSKDADRILFVAYNDRTSAELNAAMDRVLGRTNLVAAREGLVKTLREEVLIRIDRAYSVPGNDHIPALNELDMLMRAEESRAVHLGQAGRKLVEFVVDDILRLKKPWELMARIDKLPEHGVASWIVSYMHVLRVFGNESVHSKPSRDRRPKELQEADLAVVLFCISRLLEFWVGWWKEETPQDGPSGTEDDPGARVVM